MDEILNLEKGRQDCELLSNLGQDIYKQMKETDRAELIKSIIILMYFMEVEKKQLIEWEKIKQEDMPENSFLRICHLFDMPLFEEIIKVKNEFETIF